ncbi:MAG: hypothetical protein GX241_01905 [Ruminococcaceae bacterium]|nr:hypothetical protein [Oscillospiraceae bacterium]
MLKLKLKKIKNDKSAETVMKAFDEHKEEYSAFEAKNGSGTVLKDLKDRTVVLQLFFN